MKDNKRYFYIQAQKKKNIEKAINASPEEFGKYLDKLSSMDDIDVYSERSSIALNNKFARTYGGTVKKLPTYKITRKK